MKPLRIGLTGGIASGKSTISDLFAQKNICIIDADKIAKDLFKPKAPLLENLRKKFGNTIFFSSGELDRSALSKIVFNSKTELTWLNKLIHPRIAEEINNQLAKTTSNYVILDIPLLIDKTGQIPTHLKSLIDRVLVINLTLDKQLLRLCNRNNISEVEALKIINHQSSLEQKLKLADDIIDNNADLKELKEQVNNLHSNYLLLSSKDC